MKNKVRSSSWKMKFNSDFISSDYRHGSHYGYELLDSNNNHICLDLDEANAKLIVKSVNCHNDLVEALKKVKEELEFINAPSKDGWDDLLIMVKQTLSKAEKE